jgi:hypothetical protein
MRTKNLFYLLLALPLVFVACRKSSDDVVKTPASNYDVTLEAEYLLAEYCGDEFTPGVDNYSIIIAENKFQLDMGGGSLSEGSYYLLDIYAPITDDGKIPAGTYILDMSDSYAEWTIDGANSSFIEVDADGNFITDEEGITFSEATLVIKESYAELTAVVDGRTHFVTFSGRFANVDSTNDGDVIRETTLIDDVEVESDTAMFLAVVDGDVAIIVATENLEAGGAAFMLELALADGSTAISGDYSVAAGTLSTGEYDGDDIWGSWYFNVVDDDFGSAYAAIKGGSVTFVQEGDSCHMTLDCTDAEGYTIKATMSGMFISDSGAAEAMLAKFGL